MISSFLLQDIPRHPDTRLFEVREACKRSLLLGFQAHIRACIALFSPPAALRGPLRGACAPAARIKSCVACALRATGAETLITAPLYIYFEVYTYFYTSFKLLAVLAPSTLKS